MSLYNALFGQNPDSHIILATLGLTTSDVGRFRDCFVTSEGLIAVYTRNGGGNRACWHEDRPEYGSSLCKNHVIIKNREEIVDATEEEFKSHPEWTPLNYFRGGTLRKYKTGKMVDTEYYVCETPNSVECACPGCTMEYRLKNHPLYVRDVDDEFDCTYATIYFTLPAEYAEGLRKLALNEPFDPDARWIALLESLKGRSKESTKC